MGAPHPLDNEWRLFNGDYYKAFYDVRAPGWELIFRDVWPNAGKMMGYVAGECEVRLSALHPYSKRPQLSPEGIAELERKYGKWQP